MQKWNLSSSSISRSWFNHISIFRETRAAVFCCWFSAVRGQSSASNRVLYHRTINCRWYLYFAQSVLRKWFYDLWQESGEDAAEISTYPKVKLKSMISLWYWRLAVTRVAVLKSVYLYFEAFNQLNNRQMIKNNLWCNTKTGPGFIVLLIIHVADCREYCTTFFFLLLYILLCVSL